MQTMEVFGKHLTENVHEPGEMHVLPLHTSTTTACQVLRKLFNYLVFGIMRIENRGADCKVLFVKKTNLLHYTLVGICFALILPCISRALQANGKRIHLRSSHEIVIPNDVDSENYRIKLR